MRIGVHEVQRELGRGGMGVVYAVTAPALPTERALKLLTSAADLESRIRFRREAELLARVRHPGVVAIHEIGEDEQGLYLVMDLVPGEPLNQVLRRTGPVDPDQARVWIQEIAEAVSALHAQDLLHRDIKPANVILRPDGHLVLLDFGLARSAGRSSLTETGGITGSPGFLAPEQAQGRSDLTPAVDVHGLGTTLFALLSGGEPPFRGQTTFATVAAVLDQVARWPEDLPADLAFVARRSLEKSPEDRFPDAAAFRAALGVEPSEAPPPERLLNPSLLWVAIAGASLVLGAVLTALALTRDPPPAPPLPTTTESPAATPRVTQVPLRTYPRERGDRVRWYREACARLVAGEVLSEDLRLSFLRAQSAPLREFSITRREKARAVFWGADHWARARASGADWGRVDSDPFEIEGALSLGTEVTVFPWGGGLVGIDWQVSRVWRGEVPEKGLKAQALPALPKGVAPGNLVSVNVGRGDLLLATEKRVWRLDLRTLERFEPVHELAKGKIGEVGRTRGGAALLGIGVVEAGSYGRVIVVGDPAEPLRLGRVPTSFAAHPRLDLVAVGDYDARVTLWTPETGERTPLGSPGDSRAHHIRDLAFDPQGKLLYSLASLTADQSEDGPESGEVKVWRQTPSGWVHTRRMLLEWSPDHVSLSRDGTLLLVSSRRGKVALWGAGDEAGP